MAELVIPDGYGEATFKWAVAGRANPVSTSMGFKVATASTAIEAADELEGTVRGANLPCTPTNMRTPFTYLGMDSVVNEGGVMVGIHSGIAPYPGTASSTGTNLISSTLLLRKTSGLIGRRHRGRCYMPCMLVQESDIDLLGNIDESAMSFMGAIIDNWSAALLAGDHFFPVILHHEVGVTPTSITSVTLQPKTATQRRRLR